MSGHQKHDEDFKRVGLDAAGIYNGLEKEIVHYLGDAENCNQDGDEHSQADIQTDGCGSRIFHYQCKYGTQNTAGEWTHVWNRVEQSGHKGNAE